jgi:phosphatidylinositol alpha-1,6-mannosyltransferase
MEILVVTWNYPPRRGGIENLIGNLCRELRKNHSVKVVTTYSPASLSEVDVFRAPLPGLFSFALYALWRGTILLARNSGITVVFGGSVLATPLVLLLARVFGRRAVVQAHGLDIIYGSFFYRQICVRWLQHCDYVVANSGYTAGLAQARGIPQERLAIIPPGVDLDQFTASADVDAIKRSFSVARRRIILFVGRLARRKGVQEFIENSLVQIAREIPDVCFLVVGDHPAASLVHSENIVSEIEAAITKLKITEHVRLLGSLSDGDVTKLYQISDVIVLPVLDVEDDVEGFGIVALEAAASGKPVVATRVGGIPDAVEDDKSGILVAPGDYTGLSRAITALLRDGPFRAALGEFGRCRVREKFSWPGLSRSYERLMSESGSSARSC